MIATSTMRIPHVGEDAVTSPRPIDGRLVLNGLHADTGSLLPPRLERSSQSLSTTNRTFYRLSTDFLMRDGWKRLTLLP